jgi:phytol kinase
MGALVMAWGDGLAALIGRSFGKATIHPIVGKKTMIGSTTMFIVSAIVIALMSQGYSLAWISSLSGISWILIASGFATIFEAVTPLGLDNVSVPIGTAVIVSALPKLAKVV